MKHLTASFLLLAAALPSPPAAALAATAPPTPAWAAKPVLVDHGTFDRLLRKHVNARGLVSYEGFQADEKAFNQYLAQLSNNPPAAGWSKPEQMAYWINAYNAFTIRLVLNYYPLSSIKDIGSKIQIPFVNTPWAAKFIRIGGEKMSLDHIEHGVLRQQFQDPRVHFALVCASISCPRLRPEAYTAARLNEQLDDQGRDFLRDPTKNQVGATAARLSKYFDWYKGDWEKNGQSVVKWVSRYAATAMSANARVSYLPYNWNLNKQ